MSDEQTTRKRASLNTALRRGFRAAWDSLGYVVGASFAAFLISAIVTSAMAFVAAETKPSGPVALLLVVPGTLAAWLAAVGIFYYVKQSLYHEHPAPMDTWAGIRKLLRPALALFVVDAVITTVLLGDAAFFVTAFRASGSVAFAALGAISAYMALMWLMMSLYHLPLLVAQLDMDSGPKVTVILRKSFLLAADNPGFTVGLFVVIIALAVLCTLPAMLGMALVFPAAAAFLLTSSLRELFVKYGVIEEEPEVVEDKPWKLPQD